jgi:sec-independent protein translocase protein TatA
MNLLTNLDAVQYAGWIGTPEIIIIVIVVVLLFGGRKIPELMRGIGKGVKEFREGIGGEDDKKGEEDKPKSKDNDTSK